LAVVKVFLKIDITIADAPFSGYGSGGNGQN
jgi:hypothetical protein